MTTANEHMARISGGKDMQIALLRAQIDDLIAENERLQDELSKRDGSDAAELGDGPEANAG